MTVCLIQCTVVGHPAYPRFLPAIHPKAAFCTNIRY